MSLENEPCKNRNEQTNNEGISERKIRRKKEDKFYLLKDVQTLFMEV